MQAANPLGVLGVALGAARGPLDLAGVHQENLEPPGFEQVVQRNPVHAGGLHGDGIDAVLLQPVGQGVQVGGAGAEGSRTSTQSVPEQGDSDDMEVAADVGASGVGVKDVEGAAGERIGGEGWFDASAWEPPRRGGQAGRRRYNEP